MALAGGQHNARACRRRTIHHESTVYTTEPPPPFTDRHEPCDELVDMESPGHTHTRCAESGRVALEGVGVGGRRQVWLYGNEAG